MILVSLDYSLFYLLSSFHFIIYPLLHYIFLLSIKILFYYIQPVNAVEVCNFVLNDRTRWKAMSPDALRWLYDSPSCPLWAPFCLLNRNPVDPINKSNFLETQLRHMITVQRQVSWGFFVFFIW